MVPKHLTYDLKQIRRQLFLNNNLMAAAIIVCSVAETRKVEGLTPLPDEGAKTLMAVKKVLDHVYRIAIHNNQFEEFVIVYEATRYIPHGKILQGIFDRVFAHFQERLKEPFPLSTSELSIISRYVELSLEAYDRLGSFSVFITEFREFVPVQCLTKAIAIAEHLGDKRLTEIIMSNIMVPPRELSRVKD